MLCWTEGFGAVNDLLSNALLLIRSTGIRVGECVNLSDDCLRSLGQDKWALNVPLGKLHTERWVPVDEDTRKIFARILTLRSNALSFPLTPGGPLLPRPADIASRVYAALKKRAWPVLLVRRVARLTLLRIGFATPTPQRCCGPELVSPPSRSCSAIRTFA